MFGTKLTATPSSLTRIKIDNKDSHRLQLLFPLGGRLHLIFSIFGKIDLFANYGRAFHYLRLEKIGKKIKPLPQKSCMWRAFLCKSNCLSNHSTEMGRQMLTQPGCIEYRKVDSTAR